MGIAVAPYTPDFEPAVRAFNSRLEQGGIVYRFPETADVALLDAPVTRHAFVAVDRHATVRGGYLVKEQDFWMRGSRVRVGFIHLPLSEGLIDRRYSVLGAQLLAHALRRQPLMFGLGIGGREEIFARMINVLGWRITEVPFFFRPMRPLRVARRLAYARRTAVRRIALDVAALSGAAWVGTRLLHGPGLRLTDEYRLQMVDDFGPSASAIWDRCRTDYDFVAWRDVAALRMLYPPEVQKYHRLRLTYRSTPVGWAVALNTPMRAHKYFGDLRVATIVDCFAEAPHASPLATSVTRHLAAGGADLIISNQSARQWQDALRASGFRSGPSNFLFAASPVLARELGPAADTLATLHLTRGDGDGAMHL